MWDCLTGKEDLKQQNAEFEEQSPRKERIKREIEARAQILERELEQEKSNALREMLERQQKEREMVKDQEEAQKSLGAKQRAEKLELEERYKVALQQKIQQQEQAYQAELKSNLQIVNAEMEALEIRKVEERMLLEPWRHFPKNGDWNHEYHARLVMDIKEQVAHENVKNARLLFVGPTHAGKSSFINAVASIDKGRIATPMECGEATKSLTSKTLKQYKSEKILKNLILLDTLGVEEQKDEGFNFHDIIYLIEGNVKHDYKFNPRCAIDKSQSSFKANPTLADKAHCIVIVMACPVIHSDSLTDASKQKIKLLKNHIRDNDVPVVIVLTKIDQICEEVKTDITMVYYSRAVMSVVKKAAELFGVPPMNIFPVRNYTEESELNENQNILILIAIKRMMEIASDYLECQVDSSDKSEDSYHIAVEQVFPQYNLNNPDISDDDEHETINVEQEENVVKEASSWDDYIKSWKPDIHCSAKDLIASKKLPNEAQLNELHQMHLREKSTESAAVLKELSLLISDWTRNKHTNIKDAWLAYKQEHDNKVVLVIEVENPAHTTTLQGIEYENKYVTIFNQFSKEAEQVMTRHHKPLSGDDLKCIRQCINKHAKALMNAHTHLSIISPSSVRSKGYNSNQHEIVDEACITLYIRKKGYIPLGEEPFQTDYDGVKIDVREGAFHAYGGRDNESDNTLKIGHKIAIIQNEGCQVGSIGGYIEHLQYGLCGMTCAHVVLQAQELEELQEKREIIWPNFKSNTSVNLPSNNNSKIGELVKAVYQEGGDGLYGMEVALFQIEASYPTSGAFMKTANQDDDHLHFDNGKVYGPSRFPENSKCFKVGATTGMTVGFSVNREPLAIVRTHALTTSHIILHNQFEIQGEMQNRRRCLFSDAGDSGALVLLDNEKVCIGIVEGGTSYYNTIVTPIAPVLDRLNVTSFKSFETDKLRDEVRLLGQKINEVGNAQQHMEKELDSLKSRSQNRHRLLVTDVLIIVLVVGVGLMLSMIMSPLLTL